MFEDFDRAQTKLNNFIEDQRKVQLEHIQMKEALNQIVKFASEKRNPSVDFYMQTVLAKALFGLGAYDDLLGKK